MVVNDSGMAIGLQTHPLRNRLLRNGWPFRGHNLQMVSKCQNHAGVLYTYREVAEYRAMERAELGDAVTDAQEALLLNEVLD
ncbi:hypothetical protein WGP40_02055 [Brachymonas sp. G13]|uniref:hypothetical protein n=1 Tax=Brachymonas TaxID=28219 RepID=UPI0016A3B335|nr:hypothetical protein [Brachymonas sp. J145]MEE1654533.1 hypothetical protein [Brachymonas sp. J145]NLX15589.1 hypothetical protein [Ramlibacter sp.]